ncbi:MAG: YcaO-like family protein [Bacteroidales bacterium]|nr:YcaO-like family protein [Bacteroidales bacterium]
MELSINKFKDESPIRTIQKIRGILTELGILTHETRWNKLNNFCYSVRIEIDGLPGSGVNGKGTSRLFALASAYGELMERLQNRVLVSKKYGLKISDKFNHPDETFISYEKIVENEKLLKYLIIDYDKDKFSTILKEYTSLSIGAPYYHFNNRKIEMLPIRLVGFSIGTNGMCAGNTNEEALVHGICELLERYVIKKIIFDELTLPTVPLEELVGFNIYKTIRFLENSGLKIYVKDCTLGGRYPVVGVLLVDTRSNKYIFKHGSDPVFEIALERCLTEMFQGFSKEELVNNALNIEWDIKDKTFEDKRKSFENICKNGTGQFPNSIFFENKSVERLYYKPFCIDYTGSKQGLKHLLDLLRFENFEIFIRNLSFANFPTFKIYIPGISEIYIQDFDSINRNFIVAKAAKAFLNLNSCSADELSCLISELERLPINSYINQTQIFKKMMLNLDENNPLGNYPAKIILAFIYIKENRKKDAFNILNSFFTHNCNTPLINKDYYLCLLAYLKLSIDGLCPQDQIKNELAPIYNVGTIDEVILSVTQAENTLESTSLISCNDCKSCPLINYCNFPKWEEITNKILQTIENDKSDQSTLFSFLDYCN